MALALPYLSSKLGQIRAEPAATARKLFQGVVIVGTAVIVVGAFWGRHLKAEFGGQAPPYYVDAPGFGGGAELGSSASGGKPSDTPGNMASTSGTIDDWIADAYAYKPGSTFKNTAANRAKTKQLAMQESGGRNLVQQITDVNSSMKGCGGIPDNRARGPVQITPCTYEANAPAELKPASKWIMKPRASIYVSLVYQKRQYGHPVSSGGY